MELLSKRFSLILWVIHKIRFSPWRILNPAFGAFNGSSSMAAGSFFRHQKSTEEALQLLQLRPENFRWSRRKKRRRSSYVNDSLKQNWFDCRQWRFCIVSECRSVVLGGRKKIYNGKTGRSNPNSSLLQNILRRWPREQNVQLCAAFKLLWVMSFRGICIPTGPDRLESAIFKKM